MDLMWERKQATVRDIVMELRPTRPRAYTTIMTVMFHLAEKGLLPRRQQNRKTYVYTIAMSRDEFLDCAARRMVDALVEDFGEARHHPVPPEDRTASRPSPTALSSSRRWCRRTTIKSPSTRRLFDFGF